MDYHWPGLEAPAQEIQVEPETLELFADKLVGHADYLCGNAGTGRSPAPPPGVVTTTTSEQEIELVARTERQPGEVWFGDWPTAGEIENTLDWARSRILTCYIYIVQEFRAAAELCRSTADEYRDVDRTVEGQIAQVTSWRQVAAPEEVPGQAPAGELVESFEIPKYINPEDVSTYNAEEIVERIDRLRDSRPWDRLGEVRDAYRDAADRLEDVAVRVKNESAALAEDWQSEMSVAAQQALQRIVGSAAHLSERTAQVSEFVDEQAVTLQDHVARFPRDIPGRNLWEWGQDMAVASGGPLSLPTGIQPNLIEKHNEVRTALHNLNEALRTGSYHMPARVNIDVPLLPEPNPLVWDGGNGGGGPGHFPEPGPPLGSPIGTSPEFESPELGGTGTIPGAGTVPGAGTIPAGGPGLGGDPPGAPGWPGGSEVPSAPGGGLAGAGSGIGPAGGVAGPSTYGPGGIGPGGVGAGGAGVPGGGPGAVGMVPGAGTAAGAGRGAGGTGRNPGAGGGAGRGAGMGVVPMGGAGAGRGAGGTGRNPGAGGRPAGAGAGGRSTAGGMMPMGAGRGGNQEKHSRPDSWLVEDDDPWKPDDNIPPGVIR